MGSESLQQKLNRVRRPRVQITYEVHTGGALQKVELPFVVGILADLSAQRKDPLPAVKDRKFIPIDRDNINTVMAQQAPRLAMKVQNRLTDEDTKLAVELNFQSMEDFEPAKVAKQVGPLRELLEMRQRLIELLAKNEGNDKLDKLLAQVLSNTESARAMAKELGIEVQGEGETKPEETK